jgi:predicted transcriptional regulator
MMNTVTSENELRRLAAGIVTAYISHNAVPANELSGMIQSVYSVMSTAGSPPPATEVRPEPAVPIKKSVFPDYIVCLEDGKKLKMLKRHLQTAYGMTPDDYRARWGLPDTYPMVAPNYAARRSALAKESGLGRPASAAQPEQMVMFEPEPEPVEPEVVVQRIPERKRGRKPKYAG